MSSNAPSAFARIRKRPDRASLVARVALVAATALVVLVILGVAAKANPSPHDAAARLAMIESCGLSRSGSTALDLAFETSRQKWQAVAASRARFDRLSSTRRADICAKARAKGFRR